jgi:hypothetical protein
VCAEVGGALRVESTNLTRFEGGSQNVVAGWSIHGAPVFPPGDGVPLAGEAAAVAKVSRSGNAPAQLPPTERRVAGFAELVSLALAQTRQSTPRPAS